MAYYCCGVRMQDALQPQPLCGDAYAATFMDEEGLRIYDIFKDETNCNASMLVRHRIIDDALRQLLAAHPDLCVIVIGAGFDSRPYRMAGGVWVELDEAAVVDGKNARLPVSECPNPLQRIAIDFCVDALEDRLASITPEGPVVVIMEGIVIYLDEDEIRRLIEPLHWLFPGHLLVCDLVNREMVQTYGRTLHEKIEGMGTAFKPVEYPEEVFTRNGYRVKSRISVVERAADFGINKVPKLLLKWFFSSDVYGNSVYVFESYDLYDDFEL